MAKTFQLDIILPETPMPSRTVTAIDLPAADGRLTVMANHQHLIAALKAGTMKITTEDNSHELWSISAGALQFDNNIASLLVRTAENNENNEE